jgi:cold shock CspA family protein
MATGTVKWFNDAKGFGFIAGFRASRRFTSR